MRNVVLLSLSLSEMPSREAAAVSHAADVRHEEVEEIGGDANEVCSDQIRSDVRTGSCNCAQETVWVLTLQRGMRSSIFAPCEVRSLYSDVYSVYSESCNCAQETVWVLTFQRGMRSSISAPCEVRSLYSDVYPVYSDAPIVLRRRGGEGGLFLFQASFLFVRVSRKNRLSQCAFDS